MCNELRYYGGVGARCPGYGDRWGKMPRLQGPLGQDAPATGVFNVKNFTCRVDPYLRVRVGTRPTPTVHVRW